MLDVARRKLRRTELIGGDLTSEDALAGQSFDLITAFRFFANAEDGLREAVLKRLAEHLAPGGYLLFNNHHVPAALFFRIQAIVARARRRSPPPTFRMMSLRDTFALVQGAGLRVVETRHVGFFRVPKVTVPSTILAVVEAVAQRIPWLARRSESVLVLCQR
jgi:hypothetical protein